MPAPSSIRLYEHPRDLEAVERLWREVGWITEDDDAKQLKHWFACGHTLVATLDDQPECAVQVADGTMRLQRCDLPLSAVTAVTTSRIARGQAFAQQLTAQQLATAAARGAAVSALGMFDQGFYDKLGFATGSYEHELQIDPETLQVSARVPTPRRLAIDDADQMHAAMCARRKSHGTVVLEDAPLFRAELAWDDNGFGLGYDTDGVLSHFIWLACEDPEHGPYQLRWLCYQTGEQLLQLFGLLKSLSDQVYSVTLIEPPELQLQTLLRRPVRQRQTTEGSNHQGEHRGNAWWQFRILDVPACVAALSVQSEVEFGALLSDPLMERLPTSAPWRGVAGAYRVRLGNVSHAELVSDPDELGDLPLLQTGVGSFTRLIWGIMPASSLQLMGELDAPAQLLEQLDLALRLPRACTGWEF